MADSPPRPVYLTVVKMVITGNNHSLTRSLAGGRAAPTVQGGSARESRPGTPNGSAFKPPRRNGPPGQPGPDGEHPAGVALQAPVSTAPGSRPSASIRASRVPRGYAEGDMSAPAVRTLPAARNALGTAEQAPGQRQRRSLVHRQPVALHELHPAYNRTVGRVDLKYLHPFRWPREMK